MKLKTFPGKIAQLRACKCPACGQECYLAGIRTHIFHKAKNEALAILLTPKHEEPIYEDKHIDLLRKNLKPRQSIPKPYLDIEFV